MKKAVKFRALQLLDERKRTDALLLTLISLNPGVNLSAWDGTDTELELLCQVIVSKDEFNFFLHIALGATTFIEESKGYILSCQLATNVLSAYEINSNAVSANTANMNRLICARRRSFGSFKIIV